MDDYNKVTESLAPYIERNEKEHEKYNSYSELRKRNRDDYLLKMAEKYNKKPAEVPPDTLSPPVSSLPIVEDMPQEIPPSGPPPRRNKYGDIIE